VSAPTASSTSIEEALAHIEAEPVIWVRLAAMRKALGYETGGWEQMMLDLVSGAPPPDWRGLYWRYPKSLFIASEQRGDVVARWLAQQRVNLYGADVSLPTMIGPVQWERRDSFSTTAIYQALPWPSANASLGGNALGQDTGAGVLVEEGSPSFPSFYAAASYVFNVASPIGGGRATAAPTYRHQDTRARINRVQIVPHESLVRVEVEGDRLEGSITELGGDVPGPLVSLSGEKLQAVDLPMASGVPGDAFVLVHMGGRWLDRRFLTRQYGRDGEPGVEYVIEQTTRLDAFVAGREGPQVDFKIEIPHKKAMHQILQAMKSVSAFANENGGILLFGVNDEEEIIGIPVLDLDGSKNRLTDLVSAWVDPRPTISFEEFPIEGDPEQLVLGLQVEAGPDVPYMAGQPGHTKTVYIRNHSESVPARPNEIQGVVQSRVAAAEPGSIFGRGFA
jgi:hypothetical protein